jgi:hypothetical protein
MLFNSLYSASRLAWWWHADNMPPFWRLLGDGSTEIGNAYYVFMEHRDVLNQLVSLGLHMGTNDMSSALDVAYKLHLATQQLCIALRDAIVAPALWEARRRVEMAPNIEGGTFRDAFLNVCSEIFGPAFSGSRHEELMLLAVDKRFNKVELAGAHTGQEVIRPFSSHNEVRLTRPLQRMRRGHSRRHNRARNDAFESMSGIE